MSLILIGYLDPRLLKEVGDLGKSDLSLPTLPTLHRTRIEAGEATNSRSVSPWDSARMCPLCPTLRERVQRVCG